MAVKLIYLFLFLYIALLISGRTMSTTAGRRDGKSGRTEWLYVAGECAKLPRCNKYCVSNGFHLGGFCEKLSPQASYLSCVCKYT
uniref:Defensin-like protein 37 n=1 Tax=Arabidopsis thaliana TaxID=3702 RepID=DEF37_ARATH|nr:RecName: Full=Defensin-like protein 37; AltName: Full=Protein EMBRYO SAC DEVELOPMENT ARREST 21; Flags: Precursor [Arabidopsis thaliana]